MDLSHISTALNSDPPDDLRPAGQRLGSQQGEGRHGGNWGLVVCYLQLVGPPRKLSWFINPINCSYKYHKTYNWGAPHCMNLPLEEPGRSIQL